MELLNFAIDRDGISLNWQSYNLDLHNNYNFESLRYDLASKQVELIWRKSSQLWASAAQLPGLNLIFSSVSFLRIKERDASLPLLEDDCVMNISFHPVELRDDFESLSLEFSPTDDLTFFFKVSGALNLMRLR